MTIRGRHWTISRILISPKIEETAPEIFLPHLSEKRAAAHWARFTRLDKKAPSHRQIVEIIRPHHSSDDWLIAEAFVEFFYERKSRARPHPTRRKRLCGIRNYSAHGDVLPSSLPFLSLLGYCRWST